MLKANKKINREIETYTCENKLELRHIRHTNPSEHFGGVAECVGDKP